MYDCFLAQTTSLMIDKIITVNIFYQTILSLHFFYYKVKIGEVIVKIFWIFFLEKKC